MLATLEPPRLKIREGATYQHPQLGERPIARAGTPQDIAGIAERHNHALREVARFRGAQKRLALLARLQLEATAMAAAGGQASHGGILAPLGVRGIVGEFYRVLEETGMNSWPQLIGWSHQSNQETETFRAMTDQRGLSLWQGKRQVPQKAVESYIIRNEVFELSDAFPSDDFRRDKTGQIMQRVGEMGGTADQHWEELGTALIEGNEAGWDGAAYFATHSNEDSGNVDNDLEAGTVPSLNIASASAPTQTEFAVAIRDVVQQFWTWKNYAGRPVNGGAKKFGVMVPPNMGGALMGALLSERLSGGESNTLRSQQYEIVPIVNPWLTSSTIFYVFRLDAKTKPLILQEEVPILARALGLGTEYEIFNRHVFFGIEAVRNVGWGNFYLGARCTFS